MESFFTYPKTLIYNGKLDFSLGQVAEDRLRFGPNYIHNWAYPSRRNGPKYNRIHASSPYSKHKQSTPLKLALYNHSYISSRKTHHFNGLVFSKGYETLYCHLLILVRNPHRKRRLRLIFYRFRLSVSVYYSLRYGLFLFACVIRYCFCVCIHLYDSEFEFGILI